MNLGTCALCQFFLELSVWGKVAAIAGYALMALLIILWEQSKSRRHAATRLQSVIEPTEKSIHTNPAPARKQNQYSQFKRVWHLLDIFRSNLSKSVVHGKSHNARQEYLKPLPQYLPKHIRAIVDWLARRVNQSGKEPVE